MRIFIVSLSAPSFQTISVNYTTVDGTATVADQDYTLTTGTLVFSPNTATTQQIRVPVRGDTKDEPDETFTVKLSNPSNSTISNNTGIGTILNDDAVPPLPTVSINDANQNEGNTGANPVMNFTVTLSRALITNVTVNYSISGGTATAGADFTGTTGTVTILPDKRPPRCL